MGDASGQGDEASPEGLGGGHRFAQTDASSPVGEVVSHHLHNQPDSVGWKASRGETVETHAVLQVADGVLDLGMAAMIEPETRNVSVSTGDEGVMAVVGKQGKFQPGVGFTLRIKRRAGAAPGSLPNGVYSVSGALAAPCIQ